MSLDARIDELTKLPNSRSLFYQLDAELARSKRTNTHLALVVVVVGKAIGDEILKRVATALQQNCREYDCVARMDREEFVLVLSGLKPPHLREKLRRIEAVARQAGVTSVAMGAAFYPGDGSDAESLLAKAGRRLFEANNLMAARES